MNAPKRIIRVAREDDISVVTAFGNESTNDERREFVRRALDGGNAYVVEQNGRAIAVGILEYTFFENGFVSLVLVDPRERRMGVGETLLQHMVSACRTSKIFSSTNLRNGPMHALFSKLGFEVTGMIHNLNPKDPEVIYYKALKPDVSPPSEH
ncbi:MAG: GNAT family N-acetyltransferase [Verrucomicrobia bacterium]|nr:GNAT family N-acetyltransferase [Verrucomicrobiota bacterium]